MLFMCQGLSLVAKGFCISAIRVGLTLAALLGIEDCTFADLANTYQIGHALAVLLVAH